MDYQSTGEYIEIFDALGLTQSEVVTAATIAVRMNVNAEPYGDRKVRQALQLAVDNSIILELGYGGRGQKAEDHHVGPMHPEYFPVPEKQGDETEVRRLLEEAGMLDHEHELISLDDDWQRNTCDAVAAQLRDAGVKCRRTILPGATYWNDWTKYPFSATEWNMRPLGVQILALGYRSGEAWNETGYSDPEFDAALNDALAIADADKRRERMEKIETLLQDSGVLIQPYWRSLFRHYNDRVKGAEMHPTFEHHHHLWSIES